MYHENKLSWLMGGGATDGNPKKGETYKDEDGNLIIIETYKDEDGNLVIIPFTSDSPESPLYNKLAKWTGKRH